MELVETWHATSLQHAASLLVYTTEIPHTDMISMAFSVEIFSPRHLFSVGLKTKLVQSTNSHFSRFVLRKSTSLISQEVNLEPERLDPVKSVPKSLQVEKRVFFKPMLLKIQCCRNELENSIFNPILLQSEKFIPESLQSLKWHILREHFVRSTKEMLQLINIQSEKTLLLKLTWVRSQSLKVHCSNSLVSGKFSRFNLLNSSFSI